MLSYRTSSYKTHDVNETRKSDIEKKQENIFSDSV